MESVLSRVSAADIVRTPFPHVWVHEAIDETVASGLIDEFPPLDRMTSGSKESNKRFDLRAIDVFRDPTISDLWRETIKTHVSQRFLDEAVRLFAEDIKQTYPAFEKQFAPLESLRAGVRNDDSFETADVLLDAQISVNTPVKKKAGSVRRGHLDANNKLFVGLLYLRHPDDDSTGGDLELYRYTTDAPEFEGTELFSAIGDEQLELVQTIPYERNALVFFPNSPEALHGVSPREVTTHPRLFMNLVAQVPRPLFDVPVRSEPEPDRGLLRTRLLRRR